MRALVRRTVTLAAALGAVSLVLAGCNGGGAGAGSAEGDMSMGPADAPVTVVEYASVTCGHCAVWNEEVFPEFKAKYVDTGKVRYVFREFPTPPQDVAAAGFLLARCAGEDKYFQVVDAIMRAQPEMFGSGDTTAPRRVLLRVAQSAGLTEAQFNQCVADEDALVALNERIQAGVEAGVNGTPHFLVNGKKVGAAGAATMAELDAAIEPLLAEQG